MSLKEEIERFGRFPPVELRIKRLENLRNSPDYATTLSNFLSYQFDSSVVVPVDSFNFTFAAPDTPNNFRTYFQEGDVAQLFGNQVQLATGLIDQVEVSTDPQTGERITVAGRDLMGQLEDQDAVNIESLPFWAGRATIDTVFKILQPQTRISTLRKGNNVPSKQYMFGTEPGESKLAALQRFMEPLNILAWCDPDGAMRVSKPNMSQDPVASLVLDRSNRRSNVVGMKAIMAAATVPNLYVPVLISQEAVQALVDKHQILRVASERPARLLRFGHFHQKTVIVSNPNGVSPQELSRVTAIEVARAGNGNLLEGYAKREAARNGMREQIVEVIVPGHYNELGNPYQIDQCYEIYYDRAGIFGEKMYLYQVQHILDENGQRSNLYFCRVGTIVSDVKVN